MISPRISIIIPAYNEERHLGRCLDAIAAQTVQPYEVVVVDNASTDKTVEVARSYPFVRVVHEPKRGRAFARSAGFDAARGTIFGRIDADTLLPPDWVEQVTQFYSQPEHAGMALTGGAVNYNLRFKRLVTWMEGQIVFRVNRFLLGHYILLGANMALPAALWRAVRSQTCTRGDIHEDLDLSIHLHNLGYQIAYQETLQVGVKMRRVRSERGELWANMQWWPNTLKAHGNKRWIGAWFGALFLWLGSPIFSIMEGAARLLGKPPLPDD